MPVAKTRALVQLPQPTCLRKHQARGWAGNDKGILREEENMAKYRHRIFELYEFRDEAMHALTPKSARPVPEATAPESWTFTHLTVSRSASVALVQFKSAQAFGKETVNELRVDFSQLAERLVRDSKVLLDFVGVKSFCDGSVDELILFNQKLRTKGSRIALCCLEPAVHESFFNRNNAKEKQK